ncbi:MAG: hypothetical protein FJX76_15580 [Armatimonadetes bacterium]|nr:hypothetical protein [Armatimonadota bacterium]
MKRSLIALMALTLLLTQSAWARTFAEVTMADTVNVDGKTLQLNGMALRSKMGFSVYVAGLYVTSKNTSAEKILAVDAPRKMVMSFLRGVDKAKMTQAWMDGLAANTPNASADVKKNFATLCEMMADVKSKDEIVLQYVPGQGTRVWVAGNVKGQLPGKETADAILSTWIGPKPGPGDIFKNNILGKG